MALSSMQIVFVTTLTSAVLLHLTSGEMKTDTAKADGCTYNGVDYAKGQTFKDECNTCTCTDDGVTSCTKTVCGTVGVTTVGLITIGTFPDVTGDATPDVTGDPFFKTVTTGDSLPSTTVPQDVGCEYNGAVYAKGDVFQADCNTCHCEGNNLAFCTLMACEGS